MPIDVKDISATQDTPRLPTETEGPLESERATETISALDTVTLAPVSQIEKDFASELSIEGARESCPIVIPEDAASSHGAVHYSHLNTSDLDHYRVGFTWTEGQTTYRADLHSKGLGDGLDGPKWVISKRIKYEAYYITTSAEGLSWKSSHDVGNISKLIKAAYRDGDAATIKASLTKLGSIEVEPRDNDAEYTVPQVQLDTLPDTPIPKATVAKKNKNNQKLEETGEATPTTCKQYAKLFSGVKPEDVRGTAPLTIPDDAKVVSQMKNNGNVLINKQFRQIEFYWKDDEGMHYRARWHTPTCQKVLSQGNNWRVSRHMPHGEKEELVQLEGKLEWIEKEVFKALSDIQGKQKMTVLTKAEVKNTSQKSISIAKGFAKSILAAAHFFEQKTAEQLKLTAGVGN